MSLQVLPSKPARLLKPLILIGGAEVDGFSKTCLTGGSFRHPDFIIIFVLALDLKWFSLWRLLQKSPQKTTKTLDSE